MTRALALICCAAGLLVTQAVSAKPKIALTQIEGDATGDVHDAVAEALEGKELLLIASRDVNRAVDKLGDLSDLTEKDFKKLATELDADAIIAGKLDKVGGAKTLKFRLYVRKKMAKGFTVSFKDAKSDKFRTMLHDKMLDKIGVGGGGGDDEDDAKPAKKKKGADDEDDPLAKKDKKSKKAKADKADKAEADDEDARPAKKTRAAKADDADDDARPAKKAKAEAADDAKGGDDGKSQAAAADDDGAPRKAKKRVAAAEDDPEIEARAAPVAEPARGANRAAIRLDLGGSVVQRSFKFNSTQTNQQPKNTSLSPVPGARLDGEVYPLALNGTQGALAGLGLGFFYDRTIGLNIKTTDTPAGGTAMTSTVPVKQSRYSIGVRYRLAFGKTETSPTLTLGVGYGKQLFSTDLSATGMDPAARLTVKRNTPETEYTMFDPGLTFRLPLTRMFAFALGGRAMVITNAGPIQHTNSYGRARVYGAEGVAALDVVLGPHVGLRFAGEFSQVGFTFLGDGTLADADGNGQQDVGGMADRAIGGAALLTVLY